MGGAPVQQIEDLLFHAGLLAVAAAGVLAVIWWFAP